MRPTLVSFSLGEHEFALHTYGFLVGLGFAVAIIRLWRVGRRMGMDGGRLLDLAFWCLVAGVLGSRLAFVLLNARAFADACLGGSGLAAGTRFSGCWAALRFWEGGLVFYGGVIASGAVMLWFCQRERWSFWTLGDLAAPSLALGHAVGRLGCFLAGCCFGAPTGARWAPEFPAGSVAFDELQASGLLSAGANHTPRLHPTQLYEAAGELSLFLVLLWLQGRWSRPDPRRPDRALRPGALLLTYAGGYATLRFVVEMFRGDAARGFVAAFRAPALAGLLGLPADHPLFLSVSQLVSVLVLLAVGAVIVWRRLRPDVASRRAS
jgi:phosphatidylglycerol:prolipoprotein diacylglycerol transferase